MNFGHHNQSAGEGYGEQPGIAQDVVTVSWYELQAQGRVPHGQLVPEEGWQWDEHGTHLFYSDGRDVVTVHSPEDSERLASKFYASGYNLPERPRPRDGSHRTQFADRPHPIRVRQQEPAPEHIQPRGYEVGRVYTNSQGVPFMLGADGTWIPVNRPSAAQTPQAASVSKRTWSEAWHILRNDPSVSRLSYRVALTMFGALGVNVADEGIPIFGQVDDLLAPGELAVGALATLVTLVRVSRLRDPNR